MRTIPSATARLFKVMKNERKFSKFKNEKKDPKQKTVYILIPRQKRNTREETRVVPFPNGFAVV